MNDENPIHSIDIEIDGKEYALPRGTVTGQRLRDLPAPPVGADRDLYLEVPAGEDVLVQPQETIELKDDMEFFTTPSRISPGRG